MGTDVESRKGLELTPRQVAQLGVFGVVRRTFKLCYRPPLLFVQFAVVLPYTLLGALFRYFQPRILQSILNFEPPSAEALPVALVRNLWLGLLLIVALAILMFSGPLVEAAIYSGVGSIYSGKYVTHAEVLRSLPRLWWRLFVTTVYGSLLVLAVGCVSGTSLLAFFHLSESHRLLSLFMLLIALCGVIPLYAVCILYRIAVGVTCYEERYGWAAFSQGTRLLRKKWLSAMLLIAMCSIPDSLISFGNAVPTEIRNWTDVAYQVVFVLVMSWLHQCISIAWAVFYFSCTEKCQQQQMSDDVEVGYQRLAIETD